jgi:hypothetical protein
MHLLTDNDTNQSISSQEKYKNLAKLMMDDKNITEYNFVRNSEQRIKLNIYSALSKKSKELFMNDDHPNQSKNQILFHRINDIHIPKFGFKTTIAQKNEINNFNQNNSVNSSFSDNFNLGKIDKIEKNENKKMENDEPKFNECYFRQEKKGYFHKPILKKIGQKQKIKEFRKQKTYAFKAEIKKHEDKIKDDKKRMIDDIFWDPEIDGETLSYINHNFISIEDIYNGKNIDKDDKNLNEINYIEDNEPNLTPIEAKEINLYNEGINEEEKKMDGEYEDLESNNFHRFVEYIDITPKVIKSEYPVLPLIKEKIDFEKQLQMDFKDKINKISGTDNAEFPANCLLSPKKIETIIRFRKAEIDEENKIEVYLGPKKTTKESEQAINNNKIKSISENSDGDNYGKEYNSNNSQNSQSSKSNKNVLLFRDDNDIDNFSSEKT